LSTLGNGVDVSAGTVLDLSKLGTVLDRLFTAEAARAPLARFAAAAAAAAVAAAVAAAAAVTAAAPSFDEPILPNLAGEEGIEEGGSPPALGTALWA